MPKTGILLIDCPDRSGIVAAVSEFLYRRHANILHADQHQDADRGLFLMRVEWDLENFAPSFEECRREFAGIASRFHMRWRMERSDPPHRVALFVSKYDHCLVDLLYRHHSGELACEIPLVVGNHPDAQRWADFYQVPFFHIPVTPATKTDAELRQLELLREYRIDLVVLARYMQVLSADFIAAFKHPVINVHHSFLPAFSGARPYHRALERGVKLIGATGHYATQDLDEGPIIEQDVVRISHRDGLDDIMQKGRDLEKVVLSRAVRWHIAHRVLVYDRKTVVFD
jgi:formyltetrahydrofolate deformylase